MSANVEEAFNDEGIDDPFGAQADKEILKKDIPERL